MPLRAYPPDFGKNLLKAYENHLAACPAGRRDLRFKPQFNAKRSEQEQFQLLALDDVWEDARMLDVITYLMRSKKCRQELLVKNPPNIFLNDWVEIIWIFEHLFPERVPQEWRATMDAFFTELQEEVWWPILDI